MTIQTKNLLMLIGKILIIGLAVGLVGGSVYYFSFVEKSLKLVSPNGKEIFEANKTYQIKWKAKRIGKIGIMLIKEGKNEREWIAKDVPAGKGKYEWKIFVWQEPRQDYKIVIFEYPWQEGSRGAIDYSDDWFTIKGPDFASCDKLSIEREWPFIPSDYPDLRKIFITDKTWSGNLGGLDGADQKCQQEAQEKGYEGTWKAFLGSDQVTAIERLNLTGIFINAKPAATLPEGKTCHELWGKTFDEFLKKLSNTFLINLEKFEKKFLDDLSSVWVGRIDKNSKKECAFLFEKYRMSDERKNYSYTTTCQNWTYGNDLVANFPPPKDTEINYPICYNKEGNPVSAVATAGLSVRTYGGDRDEERIFSTQVVIPCNISQHLICIQQ